MKNTVFTYEELRTFTVKGLLEIAKNYDIKGRHDMKKDELISHIEMAQKETETEKKSTENCAVSVKQKIKQQLKKSEKPQQVQHNEQEEQTDEVEIIGGNETGKTRSDYINAIEAGQIIVFDFTAEKAMSAKVTEVLRGADGQIKTVLCESKKGTKFKVPASKIIWVKTGKKFPRGVYEKLIKYTPIKNVE